MRNVTFFIAEKVDSQSYMLASLKFTFGGMGRSSLVEGCSDEFENVK